MGPDDKQSSDTSVIERINSIAKELGEFRASVERRFDIIEQKAPNPSSEYPSSRSDNIVEQKKDPGLVVGRNQVKVHAVYQISEDVVEAVDQLQYEIRSGLPSRSKKKITKSVLAEMALRLGLNQLENKKIRNQQINNFLISHKTAS